MWCLQVHNPIQLKTALLQKFPKAGLLSEVDFQPPTLSVYFRDLLTSIGGLFLQFRKADFAIFVGVREGRSVLSLHKESHRQITKVCLGRWWRSRLAGESNCEVRAAFLDQIAASLVRILLVLLWHKTVELCLNCNMSTVSNQIFCLIKLKSEVNTLNLYAGENSTVLTLCMMGFSPPDQDRVRKLAYLLG